MRDGPRRFPQNSSCSAVLRCRLASSSSFRVRDYHPLWCQFPQASATLMVSARRRSYNPGRRRIDGPGLGSCAFARHYLRNHSYFLLLRVLRCFSSPGSPTTANVVCQDHSRRVSPFGHPRVAGHLPLAAAFRSLSRPSSPPRATGIPHAPFMSFLVSSRARPPRGLRRGGTPSQAFSTF